ncbi:hypothetical protein RF11_04425 [Thelohanellus kitauei]|uniref:Uncharacterized protein n=1 Tax=Thelohanellus kitauei TaxID=669202 RepID=A0A0C2I6Q7_THEKT|nr:hypothetical protein RF11_04425 [Thelohanellus kitauei]
MNLELFSCRKHKSSYNHRTCNKIYERIRTIFVTTHEAASSIATISNYDNLTRSTVSSILHKFRKGASVEKKKEWWNKPIKMTPDIKNISEIFLVRISKLL